MEKKDIFILGFFDCYIFDKMFPFQDYERYPIKSGEWTGGYGGVLLKGITDGDIKDITEHIILNGYLKEEIKIFELTPIDF